MDATKKMENGQNAEDDGVWAIRGKATPTRGARREGGMAVFLLWPNSDLLGSRRGLVKKELAGKTCTK